MYIPDGNDLLCQKDLDDEQKSEKLPVCFNCKDKITTETLYEITIGSSSALICPECMSEFIRWTEDYV